MMKSVLISFLFLSTFLIQAQDEAKTFLFLGTFTNGKPDHGIFVYEFNSTSGELTEVSKAHHLINPSFLTLASDGAYLYACTDSQLAQDGNVAAFKIDSINGSLSFINKESSMGRNPAYLTLTNNNNYLINGNYSGGNVSVYKTLPDGSVSPCIQQIKFEGSSVIKGRQEKSHIHAAVLSPENDFLYLPDLGADKIRGLQFDMKEETPLITNDNLTVNTEAGSGPRHFIFHPSADFAYSIEELSGMISAYAYKRGRLDPIQRQSSYSTKQEAYSGADIHISPDGLFLYASNRGENTIAIFSIDPGSGKLKLAGHESTYGDHPRNFTLDPSGNFLLVGNMKSDTIIVFKRNRKTGLLKKTKYRINVPRPACLKMKRYGS